ncbi:(2Fe-2S) ferredoxin domain-containing protein [Synechococcus sp. MIT S9451]|uniref:(2Fe-2S) ferredoxin domain-containing protein n=1 Tax=Synechococcus sp. MIT S9451 TaxID=3082543 RepID=UPI0039B38DFE
MNGEPSPEPRISHHLLLCATPTKAKCCDPELGLKSWDALKRLIRELDLENPQRPEGMVLRSKVDCLRICEQGPILLIWPDGIWYREVTPERIETILREHVVRGRPCQQWMLKRTPLSSVRSAAHPA